MTFASIEFLIFLPIVFCLYWLVFNKIGIRATNWFIVAASYLFYGFWSYRFLVLILFTSLFSYGCGLLIERWLERDAADPSRPWRRYAKAVNAANIVINLGILCLFKYYNFFVSEFAKRFLGADPANFSILMEFVLPVGISFYTFQALSYTIDVYRGNVRACREPGAYLAYIAFFPQLVAGPIERASNLLPQFASRRKFDYNTAADGMRLILWGLVKKVVVADTCGVYADRIFQNFHQLPGSSLLLGAILFTVQIYGDFSGYSDIAIGTARLFGIRLTENFRLPYFSRNIGEFWRRWHISLTSWFRDYLYIPLGGSREGWLNMARNVFIVFILSGLWHGANWTFMMWGLYNAVLLLIFMTYSRAIKRDDSHSSTAAKRLKTAVSVTCTLVLVVIGWIIFRSSSLHGVAAYLSGIFSPSLFAPPEGFGSFREVALKAIIPAAFLFGVEWFHRNRTHSLDISRVKSAAVRWSVYYTLIIVLLFYYLDLGGEVNKFIYFQF